MAKKQTRRSISVSRTTYERLKAFCEANNISMSQLVETRVNDFLGNDGPGERPDVGPTHAPTPRPSAPTGAPARPAHQKAAGQGQGQGETRPAAPMTSAAARYAVEPPPPIIKQKQETAAPKPVEKRPDQIFTF